MNTNTNTTTTTTDLDTTPTATDLAIVERTALDRLTKSQAKDDLDDFLRGGRRSLLLIDTSSSMSTATRSGSSRIDVLRDIVRTLRAERNVPTAAFGRFMSEDGGFTTVRLVDEVPYPAGMTPMSDAIDFARREGATHAVIVTDGEPDSEERTMTAARTFANPIDVFYVGDPGQQGEFFAQQLALSTGGTFGTADLGRQAKQLTSKIAGLLGDGN
jgi:Mg-chelatase subunit ChlD